MNCLYCSAETDNSDPNLQTCANHKTADNKYDICLFYYGDYYYSYMSFSYFKDEYKSFYFKLCPDLNTIEVWSYDDKNYKNSINETGILPIYNGIIPTNFTPENSLNFAIKILSMKAFI